MSRPICVLVLLLVACAVLAAPVPQRQPFKTGWDEPKDPDGDCKFIRDADTLTIEVPGKDHDFVPQRKRFNAPRLLRDIEGDFAMQVRVRGAFRPSAKSTVEGIPSRVAAGLLLMPSDNDCIHWEYEVARVKGGGMATYTSLRAWDSATIHLEGGGTGTIVGHGNMDQAPSLKREVKPASRRAEEAEPIYLRLERNGRFLRLLSSPDGEKWEALFNIMKNVEIGHLPAKVKVGLAAYSTSTEPFKVRFDQFKLIRKRKK